MELAVLTELISPHLAKPLRKCRVEDLADSKARLLARPALIIAECTNCARGARRSEVIQQIFVWHVPEWGMLRGADLGKETSQPLSSPRPDRLEVQVAIAHTPHSNAARADEPQRLTDALFVRYVWPKRHTEQW